MDYKTRFTEMLAYLSPDLLCNCRQLILSNKNELIKVFYSDLLADKESSAYLAATAVEVRLAPAMEKWLEQLVNCDSVDKFEAFMLLQHHIGEAHGRAEIPVYLVLRGMNNLKRACFKLLQHQILADEILYCYNFYQCLFELSFENMTKASTLLLQEHIGHGFSLKLLETIVDPINEKERQLHALSIWENQIFFEAAINQSISLSQQLSFSPFTLWLTHKAAMLFNGREDYQRITAIIELIDQTTLTQLIAINGAEQAMFQRQSLLLALRQQVSQIRLLLSDMFDQLKALDAGQDPLTQLLNRRFLPAIFQREIKFSRQNDSNFAVAIIDIDHFKRINDSYGHDAGDSVLKQISFVMQKQVRASDFLFRFGGEEFLLILVEVSASQAMTIAEQLRKVIENNAINIPSGELIQVTVSIGVTLNAGHSDYEHIIQRADEALYQAKNAGRNLVVQL